ncbi:MAG: 30S ribosomal protein S9 [Methanomassiliicoccales archaeon]
MSDTIIEIGKRKTAVATAVVKKGAGRVRINSVPLEIYSPEIAREKIREPLLLAGERAGQVDVDIRVRGGGYMGQADAARTAIAKGILAFLQDPELEARYKQYDRSLLISDPRRKMPKRPQGRGARKKKQKSYR